MDYTLLNILKKMVAIEEYKKKPKFRGIVKEKKLSKKGNIILIIKKQKYEEGVLVNKNKTDLFEIAEKLKPKDEVYVEGEKGINIIFCDRLKVLKKGNNKLSDFMNTDGEQRL